MGPLPVLQADGVYGESSAERFAVELDFQRDFALDDEHLQRGVVQRRFGDGDIVLGAFDVCGELGLEVAEHDGVDGTHGSFLWFCRSILNSRHPLFEADQPRLGDREVGLGVRELRLVQLVERDGAVVGVQADILAVLELGVARFGALVGVLADEDCDLHHVLAVLPVERGFAVNLNLLHVVSPSSPPLRRVYRLAG